MIERCEPDLNRRITVLQTGALPLGYRTKAIQIINDSNGNRTRVTAVKGRCLNRLTMEPLILAPAMSQALPAIFDEVKDRRPSRPVSET